MVVTRRDQEELEKMVEELKGEVYKRKQAEEEIKRLAQETAAIAEIGRIISSTLNIEEVYEGFAEEVHKLIPFDRIGINAINPQDQSITIAYVSGLDIPDRRKGDRFSLVGSLGEDLLTRRSGILFQADEEKEWMDRFPALLSAFQSGIRSTISVPLFSHDQVIAALHIQSLKPSAYTEAELKVAEKVSNQIAGAIANAQLFAEHERSEMEKLSLQDQLRQSQKMEAIGRLAGGVAHDFNNLLTVITGYCELSLLNLSKDDPGRQKLNEIAKAADRAANLTRQLLAFSRRQILEMKVINLNIILKDLDKMLHRVVGEDIDFKTVFVDELGLVKVDPGQMEQVLINLVVNAKDAMPSGGNLTIETANTELDERYTRSHAGMIPGAYVMLSVSDSGVGMTREVQEQIFDPFFTTKGVGKGTGLGLSTVYGIVKQSGGDIYVYSEPNKGTTFKVYLPRVFEPLEEFKKEVPGEKIPQGNETVLVVEDDGSVRKVAVDILKMQGYKVLEATGGEEALIICEKEKNPIHLILTDVVMPKMNGPQLIERLKQAGQDFKVLYMSGYADETVIHHRLLERGVNIIHKPFTVEKLARKVREVLDKN
jgi:Signal transduction histidine kinase regulating C4-dicarboxylate transport system